MKPVHTFPTYFFKTNFNISLLSILGLPWDLSPSSIPGETSLPMPATYSTQLILDFIIYHLEEGASYEIAHCSFLQPPTTSSLLGPNILLSTQPSNILNLYSSVTVRDQVSHPYKTTSKFIIMNIQFSYYLT
jgi:hypothetical protein